MNCWLRGLAAGPHTNTGVCAQVKEMGRKGQSEVVRERERERREGESTHLYVL